MDDMRDIRDAVMNKFSLKKQPVEETTNAKSTEMSKAKEAESTSPETQTPVKERQRRELGLSALAEVLKKDISMRKSIAEGIKITALDEKREKVTSKVNSGLLKGLIHGMG